MPPHPRPEVDADPANAPCMLGAPGARPPPLCGGPGIVAAAVIRSRVVGVLPCPGKGAPSLDGGTPSPLSPGPCSACADVSSKRIGRVDRVAWRELRPVVSCAWRRRTPCHPGRYSAPSPVPGATRCIAGVLLDRRHFSRGRYIFRLKRVGWAACRLGSMSASSMSARAGGLGPSEQQPQYPACVSWRLRTRRVECGGHSAELRLLPPSRC